MTTPDDLINRDLVEIQGDAKYVYYDVDRDENVEITLKEALHQEISYIYCSDNVLYIEVSKPD